MKTLKSLQYLLLLTYTLLIPSLSFGQNIPVTTSFDEARKAFIIGRDMLENIEFTGATAMFDKAISLDDNFSLAYAYMAMTNAMLGDQTGFQKNMDKAISLSDQISEGEKNLIRFYKAIFEGNPEKSKEFLAGLEKDFPGDLLTLLAKSQFHVSSGDTESALKYTSELTQKYSNYGPGYNILGYMYLSQNNYEEAEKAFKKYISIAPDRGNPYDSYGELLLNMGRYDESIFQYQKALEKDPVNMGISYNGLGNNYMFKGDFDKARAYYQKYSDNSVQSSAKLSAINSKAISYVYEGRFDDAIKTYDDMDAIAQRENLANFRIASLLNRGIILCENGKPAEGLSYLQKTKECILNSSLSQSQKEAFTMNTELWESHFLADNGENDKARAVIDNWITKTNSNNQATICEQMACVESTMGNYDKAIEFAQKAGPGSPLLWYYTALAYDKKGDKENARKMYQKIAGSNTSNLYTALYRKHALEALK